MTKSRSRVLTIFHRSLLIFFASMILSSGWTAANQSQPQQSRSLKTASGKTSWMEADRAIAARFAPVIYQGIAGTGRFDFITNFDFDGDWIGDNNWAHAEKERFPLKGYVYWALSETDTHYFLCYAFYHPRDWKGGKKSGRALSGTIREVVTLGQHVKSPPGLMDDLVLSHENDLEGCMVAVAKGSTPGEDRVVLVETVAHNKYLIFALQPYTPDTEMLATEGSRPVLYIEAKGHGVHGYMGQNTKPVEPAVNKNPPAEVKKKHTVKPPTEKKNKTTVGKIGGFFGKAKNITKAKNSGKSNKEKKKGSAAATQEEKEAIEEVLIYRFTGTAEDPRKNTGSVGYNLLPIYDTFWKHAQAGRGETYGEADDYGVRTIGVKVLSAQAGTKKIELGRLGSALRGKAGAPNKARPPWGWFDMSDRSRPLGEWFFDPASTLQRHLGSIKNWSAAYIHNPFMQIIRGQGIN
jgi:hypothetical protein